MAKKKATKRKSAPRKRKPAKDKVVPADMPGLPTTAECSHPVNIALPNTTEEKMQAICDVAEAIKEAAKALNSVNTRVNVENCHFQTSGLTPALVIESKDS